MPSLSDATDIEIQEELTSRDVARRKLARDIDRQARFNREPCPILGRGYWDIGPKNLQLAVVAISGNSDLLVPLSVKVAPVVEAFLGNVVPHISLKQFHSSLKTVVDNFIEANLKTPIVVLELMGHSSPTRSDNEAYNSWLQGVSDRLDQFTLQELRDLQAKKPSVSSDLILLLNSRTSIKGEESKDESSS